MNNALSAPPDTLIALTVACRRHNAVVIASVRDSDGPSRLLNCGALVDPNTLIVKPHPNETSPLQFGSLAVASGPSVEYPGVSFEKGLNVDNRRRPLHLTAVEFGVQISWRDQQSLLTSGRPRPKKQRQFQPDATESAAKASSHVEFVSAPLALGILKSRPPRTTKSRAFLPIHPGRGCQVYAECDMTRYCSVHQAT